MPVDAQAAAVDVQEAGRLQGRREGEAQQNVPLPF